MGLVTLIALRPVFDGGAVYTTGQPREVPQKVSEKLLETKRWKKATKADLAKWKKRPSYLLSKDAPASEKKAKASPKKADEIGDVETSTEASGDETVSPEEEGGTEPDTAGDADVDTPAVG